MNINFNQLDQSRKAIHFLEGIYPLETDKKFSWVWTSKKISGIVSNIEFITIKALSQNDNTLTFDNNVIEIKSDSLNIIKLNVFGKESFTFELTNTFNPPNDDRELGIKIVGILVDGEIIF